MVEMLIGFAIFSIISVAMWTFFVQSRHSEKQLSTGFAAQQDLMLAVQRLSREMQEGVSVYFPRPEDGVRQGVGFVTAGGRAIIYSLERPDPGPDGELKPGTLLRTDLIANTRKVVASQVNYFRARAQQPAPGKKVCLVNLNLSTMRGDKDDPTKADDYNIVTKVFLRNLKKDLPE